MAGFKRSQPGIRFSGEKVTADEEDQYVIYSIGQPGTAVAWFASAGTAGTSTNTAYVIINRYPDYPRNINYILAGTGAGMAGTFTTNGYDQFGNKVTEVVAIGTAANGGTVVGTTTFARVDSGTLNYGTAVGNGTPQIGFVPGTACLFGLPVPIAGSADVVFASMLAGTGAITLNGGTVGALVTATTPAGGTPPVASFRAFAALTGSQTINVWIKSSYVPDSIPVVSNLKLAV